MMYCLEGEGQSTGDSTYDNDDDVNDADLLGYKF